MTYMWIKYRKPDPSMTCNRTLAGLVAITAPCAFVNGISAVIIGAIAGILVCLGVRVLEDRFKVDDPVGAIAVHGINGLWGLIALGIFADGTYGAGWNGVGAEAYLGVAGKGVTGLLYGDPGQLAAQAIAGGVAFVYGLGLSYIFYKAVDMAMKMRVSTEEELAGLDIAEMGVPAYPDFVVATQDIGGSFTGSSTGSFASSLTKTPLTGSPATSLTEPTIEPIITKTPENQSAVCLLTEPTIKPTVPFPGYPASSFMHYPASSSRSGSTLKGPHPGTEASGAGTASNATTGTT